MPTLPSAPCRAPGCPKRASYRGLCDRHARSARAERRVRNHEHLYNAQWWRDSRAFLAEAGNQFCKTCAEQGKQTKANTVAHIVAHKGDTHLFNDRTNWQPSCRDCNSSQASRLEGRWGAGSKVPSTTSKG